MTTAGDKLLTHRNYMNRCDVPPWAIASSSFNTAPSPLHIAGVRRSNRRLFARLDDIDSPLQRANIFHEYLCVKFALHHWNEYAGTARSSLRNSYVRFLNGWGMDSNSRAGAVLKNWVQSRFGVVPTYHRGILKSENEHEAEIFAYDRMKGSARTNAIDSQLDLLYEFCQYELHRRYPGTDTRTLYRGTNDPEEHFVQTSASKRRSIVRLNNLVSFTADRERAWEFGSTVWRAVIANCKIVFFSDLIGKSILQGEAEYLVIGGEYEVEELIC